MGSQTDLDQGGTNRQWVKADMGPSIGYVWVPLQNILPIVAAGTFNIDPSVSLIEVNVAGAVIIILPTVVLPPAGATALSRLFAKNPITIVDIGNKAQANPITIKPNNVGETIMGLTQIQIGTNYGGFTLLPVPGSLTWQSISP